MLFINLDFLLLFNSSHDKKLANKNKETICHIFIEKISTLYGLKLHLNGIGYYFLWTICL